jgi:hypothetical protein
LLLMVTPDSDVGTGLAAGFVPRWRFRFLLPARFNPDDPVAPGEAVPSEHFIAVEEELIAQFGGFSVFGGPNAPVVHGRWRDEHGGYADEHYLYEVVSEQLPEYERFLLSLYGRLLSGFRQREVFLTVENIRVGAPAAAQALAGRYRAQGASRPNEPYGSAASPSCWPGCCLTRGCCGCRVQLRSLLPLQHPLVLLAKQFHVRGSMFQVGYAPGGALGVER